MEEEKIGGLMQQMSPHGLSGLTFNREDIKSRREKSNEESGASFAFCTRKSGRENSSLKRATADFGEGSTLKKTPTTFSGNNSTSKP